MKLIVVVVTISIAYLVQADMYTNRYDGMNVDDVLGNPRLLHAYVKCTLGVGRCTPEGRELKNHITDALQTGCSKCTTAQKKAIRHIIKHMMEKEQDSWTQLVDKYDPERKYTSKYEKFMI